MTTQTLQKRISGIRVVWTLIPVLLLRFILVTGIFLKYLLLIFMIELFAAFAFSFFDKPESYYLVKHILLFDHTLLDYAKQLIPTTIKGFDFSRILLIAIAFFTRMFVEKMTLWTRDNAALYKFKFKQTLEKWKADKPHPDDAAVDSPLRKDLKKFKKGKLKKTNGRAELLKLLGDVQRNLDSMKRNLAFLSIDVVDSVGMKEGEAPSTIELNFLEYKQLVEKAFKDNGYLKAAWTPDGVMCCFETANAAIKSARQVITDLKSFNRYVKTIKKDFKVRCGINVGNVAYDESVSAEEMCDRVIDVAGHLQKSAPPDTIYISKAVYMSIPDREKFQSVEKLIDNEEVYLYK